MSRQTYIAFLRGINVGGHHKVPMADLRATLEELGLEKVTTLLNSGNVIFKTTDQEPSALEGQVASHLEGRFNFPIPTIIRTAEQITTLLKEDPLQVIDDTKDIRKYVSFLRKQVQPEIEIPWTSDDQSYRILKYYDGMVVSVLDLAHSKTPKAMDALERFFGKDITTRNWNTILRIGKKIG